MKPLLSNEFRDKVKRFNKINAIDPAKIVDEGLELCPSGTRDELAELETLRERCAALETELDDMRAHFVAANGEKRIWRRLNRLHIRQRDLAQAKAEAWKRSRNDWRDAYKWHAANELAPIALSDAQARGDYPLPEIVPFESDDESEHAPGGLSPLSAKDTTLLDDLDEIGVMLQDYARTDDHTARHAASSLLSTATSNYTERAESAATTPSEKQPCPLCEGSGQYINTYGNPVFPCNACGGEGMVD